MAAHNTGLAKVAVQCSADSFVVNQTWFSASTFVVKIATSPICKTLAVSIKRHCTKHKNTDKMKTTLITLFFLLSATISFAQSTSETPIQIISTDSAVSYRLFSTRNMYTFIKLDTRNGKMWQVQWSTKGNEYRFESTLSDISRVNKDEEKNGRFFLYPTTNIYNFILLDQIDGRTWQVQWGKEEERAVIRIY